MRIEGHGHKGPATFGRPPAGLLKDRLMPEVDPVEVPDRQTDTAERDGQLLKASIYVHYRSRGRKYGIQDRLEIY
jgi:hypothetical protein